MRIRRALLCAPIATLFTGCASTSGTSSRRRRRGRGTWHYYPKPLNPAFATGEEAKRKMNPMKTRTLLFILAAAIGVLSSGCATAARRNNALVAAQYGTDVFVLDKLERGARLTFADLEELGRRGVPGNAILAHLNRRDDAYRLTTTQVVRRREAGVCDGVIDYLLASRERRIYPAYIYRYGYHDPFGHHYAGFNHWGDSGHGFGYGHGGHH